MGHRLDAYGAALLTEPAYTLPVPFLGFNLRW